MESLEKELYEKMIEKEENREKYQQELQMRNAAKQK